MTLYLGNGCLDISIILINTRIVRKVTVIWKLVCKNHMNLLLKKRNLRSTICYFNDVRWRQTILLLFQVHTLFKSFNPFSNHLYNARSYHYLSSFCTMSFVVYRRSFRSKNLCPHSLDFGFKGKKSKSISAWSGL